MPLCYVSMLNLNLKIAFGSDEFQMLTVTLAALASSALISILLAELASYATPFHFINLYR